MHEPPPTLRERRPAATGASRTGVLIAFGRPVVIAAIAGLFMAYVGAFGTGAATLGQRLGYWVGTMVATSVVGFAIFRPAERRGWLDRRPLPVIALLALVMAAPLTVMVWFMSNAVFTPRELMANGPRSLPGYFPPVLLISGIMTAINYLAATRAPKHNETHAAPAGAPPPKFLERIPPKLRGGELYAVEAEDHYLRVYTARGSDLILMRLADAVAELEGIEGAQTHRSWWVAKDAVTDARRADGRAVLTLKNGLKAPVSRSYAGALRETGWF
jgi:hypothetical protein